MNINYYWINIDKSEDRRIFMETQFKINKINNTRISAITPEDFDEVLEDKMPYYCGNIECVNKNHCKYEYACICSHLNAMKEALKSNDDYFVIVEDDIYLPFKIDYEKIIKNIPKDFEIFQMMVLYANTTEQLYNHFYSSNIDYIKYVPIVPSTGHYLITRKGAEKLLDLCTNKKTGKYDFREITIIKVADILLYVNAITYVSSFPFSFPYKLFKSEIHPDHVDEHTKAINTIIEKINKDKMKNIYITDYYPCEDFEKLSRLYESLKK